MRLIVPPSSTGGDGTPIARLRQWWWVLGPTVNGRGECGAITDLWTETVVVYVAWATATIVAAVHMWALWDAASTHARGNREDPRGTAGLHGVALVLALFGVLLFLRDVGRCANQAALFKLAGTLVIANLGLPWLWEAFAAPREGINRGLP